VKKLTEIDPKVIAELVNAEISTVVGLFKEKGAKRFGRAIGAAAGVAFGAYFLLYSPPQKKSALLQAQIEKARALATAAARYKDLHDQLAVAYGGLPTLNEREQWLSNSTRDSLNVSGLVTEDFKPVEESKVNGLIFQVSAVAMSLRFAELFDWILRVENAKPLMHLQSVDLQKRVDVMGLNQARCQISTVIPEKRFR
jgi:type II secretory pathway component PulM